MALLAYLQRWGGGFADSNAAKPVDAQFLNAVETALLGLLGAAPTDGQVSVYDNALGRFKTILLTNAHIDPAAAIAKSKLASLQITDTDVAAGAAISKSKLNLGSSLSLISATVILNGTTSYAAPGNATKLELEGVAGGGGSSGCAAAGATTNLSLGPGGGGASYAYKLLLSNLGTHTVAVGAGGTAGGSGATTGGNGGDTTFADSTSANVLTAKGGGGGQLGECLAGATTVQYALGGSAGGAGAVGDLLLAGELALSPRFAAAVGWSLGGRSPILMVGGQSLNSVRSATVGSNGAVGSLYGGGASGGIDTNNVARSGAAGANGILFVKAYA